MARYRADGIAGLADRSHAPKQHPWRIAAEVEAVICELRRAHRRWGPRRLRGARADIMTMRDDDLHKFSQPGGRAMDETRIDWVLNRNQAGSAAARRTGRQSRSGTC